MGDTIGARLRQLRRLAGLKQDDLADKIGVATKTLQRWEYDETSPKASDVTRICKALGINEAELLNGPNEKEEWRLTIKMEATQMIDLSGKSCISALECSRNGAALQLGGSYEIFSDDAKFEDFLNQLRAARALVVETGRKMKEIGNKAEG